MRSTPSLTVNGTEIGTGTIDAGSTAIDSYCLADGCYIIQVTLKVPTQDEITWSISMETSVVSSRVVLVSQCHVQRWFW